MDDDCVDPGLVQWVYSQTDAAKDPMEIMRDLAVMLGAMIVMQPQNEHDYHLLGTAHVTKTMVEASRKLAEQVKAEQRAEREAATPGRSVH